MIIMLKNLTLHLIATLFLRGRKGLCNADEALRYLPISDQILRSKLDSPKILEVGSGVTGITPYIPFKITGVDVVFNGTIADNLEPVCHSGDKLPFPDASYDYVISVDMLEHVPEAKRGDVITELLRVARKRVFLAVPCGKPSEDHDKYLDDLYQQAKGERYHFFQEHVELGLPTKDGLLAYINSSAKALRIPIETSVISNVNLKVRAYFMRIWITSKTPKLYTWVSPFFCILRGTLNHGECYRQIFVINLARNGSE